MSLNPKQPKEAPIKVKRYGDMLLEYCELDGKAILSRVVAPPAKSYIDPLLYPGADISAIVGLPNNTNVTS